MKKGWRISAITISIVALLLTLWVAVAYAQSTNNTCPNATAVTPLPFTDTVDITSNTDNQASPSSATGGPDAFWLMDAPAAGFYVIDTFCSDFDTVVSVWSGACGSLTEVASNDDFDGSLSRLSFKADGTSDYLIVGEGRNGAVGSLTVNVSPLAFDPYFTVSLQPPAVPGGSPTFQVVGTMTGGELGVATAILVVDQGSADFSGLNPEDIVGNGNVHAIAPCGLGEDVMSFNLVFKGMIGDTGRFVAKLTSFSPGFEALDILVANNVGGGVTITIDTATFIGYPADDYNLYLRDGTITAAFGGGVFGFGSLATTGALNYSFPPTVTVTTTCVSLRRDPSDPFSTLTDVSTRVVALYSAVGGEVYAVDMYPNKEGQALTLWIGVALILALGVGVGVLALRRRRAN